MAVETPELLVLLSLAQFLLWSWCGLQAWYYWRLPVYHPTSLFLAYYFLGWVLRPLAIVATGSSPIWDWVGNAPTPTDAAYGAAIGMLALLAFCYGPLLLWPNIYAKRSSPTAASPSARRPALPRASRS